MKLELFFFWFMVATTPVLAALMWWSKMELQKQLSRPIKIDTPENREAIEALVKTWILLCKAIQEKKDREQQ
jgi:hypothetical protein